MKSARSPPWKKETPTNDPELLEIWQNLYREFHIEQGIRKSRALDMIGEEYGVSGTTVRYHLFPEYKNYQKKVPSKKWSYEKADPEIHQKRIDYKSKYMATRRHIDDHIKKAYEHVDPQETLTLAELSDAIGDVSDISFHPDTISGLVNRFEKAKGYKLLDEIPGYQSPNYRLARPNNHQGPKCP